ncbi:MarR family winged helix-turn-helix transcriptional regulator [Flavisphingomonas formosensis]|uniref:MarR family winged helix-turn-helix transcriptional regulator n=1 Tax=Flavisphingomonas formosensis TaxID=861534 RepID=UPI0012FCF425|nr:MarR family transcriptional regulator [Sphingomonas formosensis]
MDYSKLKAANRFRLGFLVHDVSRLRRTVVDKVMKPVGITRSQWWVLTNLARDSSHEMMQTELAKVLDIGKVALGGLLDRLEASGYIERKADPADRRAKRIVMTPAGEKVLEGIQARAVSLNHTMLDGVTAEEIHLAEDILHRMKRRLIEMDAEMKDRNPSQQPDLPDADFFSE